MREVRLDNVKYGLAAGHVYTFRKWSASRALGELDWLATHFGAAAAETVAALAGGLALGTLTPAEAASGLGELARSWGRAGAWATFLRMAEGGPSGGLWVVRPGVKTSGIGAPVWPEDSGQQQAIKDSDLDPDVAFAEDPTEVLRLMLAMVCESLRPFGAARESVARAWSLLSPGASKVLASLERALTEPATEDSQPEAESTDGSSS